MPAYAALPPKDPGARLRWKTPRQFPGESLKSSSDQELLSKRDRCQSRRAGARSGHEARSHPPFLSRQKCPRDTLLLQPAVPFGSCSCHQLSEAGSLMSPRCHALNHHLPSFQGCPGFWDILAVTIMALRAKLTQRAHLCRFLIHSAIKPGHFCGFLLVSDWVSAIRGKWARVILPILVVLTCHVTHRYFNTPALGQL